MSSNMYHVLVPLTSKVCYHETNEKVFPSLPSNVSSKDDSKIPPFLLFHKQLCVSNWNVNHIFSVPFPMQHNCYTIAFY